MMKIVSTGLPCEPLPSACSSQNVLPQQAAMEECPCDSQSLLRAFLKGAGVPGVALPAELTPEWMDNKRPWLAALILTVTQVPQDKYDAAAGVDRAVMAIARTARKPMRYFETMDQQFALLAPDDNKLELSEFETDLHDFREQHAEIGPLVAAWSAGDPAAINKLMNAELGNHPDAKKALLDDRNKRWALQIETMLLEKRTFFITVGAGHLAGSVGVPALLRKAGYRVDGP